MMKKNLLTDLISALLILLFMYTSINKLVRFDGFEEVLDKSPLIGGYALPVAIIVLLVEIGISGLLFFHRTRRIGFYASFFLMLLFTGYIGGMLVFSSKLPCSCGGVLSELTWTQHLFFNLFFVLISATGIRLTRMNEAFARQSSIASEITQGRAGM
jgi:predicted secreted protein